MWDRIIDMWCRIVGHNWFKTDPHRDACARCHLHRPTVG